jgi:hypothetical protein
MYNPSQADVRRFFCAVFEKARQGQVLQAIEVIASGWMDEHPEFHGDLAHLEASLEKVYDPAAPGANPFLHLSMHLSITEQCSIDQPRGIRQAVELLTARRDDLHLAHHEVMECLAQMIADAQANGQAPDGAAYIEAVQRRATKN